MSDKRTPKQIFLDRVRFEIDIFEKKTGVEVIKISIERLFNGGIDGPRPSVVGQVELELK